MTPTYHIKQTSTSIEEHNLAQSLTVSSSSGRAFFSSDPDVGGPCRQELQSPQLRSEDDKLVERQGLHDQLPLPNSYERPEDQEDHDDHSSPKWLPSKIRIIRKMRGPDQVDGSYVATNSAQKFQDQKQFASPSIDSDSSSKGTSNRNADNTVRVCSDCNTTKTPLWRSGPRGPKSLCNACGIRQRKARRALAAASGTYLPPATSSIKIKVKRTAKRSKTDGNDDPQFKRGCKNKLPPNSSPRKKNNLCYEDFTLRILGKHYSAYQRVFPQDEREAAILLMALSYGLVRG